MDFLVNSTPVVNPAANVAANVAANAVSDPFASVASNVEAPAAEAPVVEESAVEESVVTEPVAESVAEAAETDEAAEVDETAEAAENAENAESAESDGATRRRRPMTAATRARLERQATTDVGPVTVLNAPQQSEEESDAWQEIFVSLRQKRPLVGTLSGVETWRASSSASGIMPCGVVYYKGVKVIIPATEFFMQMPEDDEQLTRTKSILYHRLGSEVRFVATRLANTKDQLVAGSRKEVMRSDVRRVFFAKKRGSDEYAINEGSIVKAKVVSALAFGVIVEMGGIDYMVPTSEVSYFRVHDNTTSFENGDEVNVKVIELDRSDPDNVKVQLSIKQAYPNPFEKAKTILQTNAQSSDARYVGTVSYVDRRFVYVDLTTSNLQVSCRFPRELRIPKVGDKVFVRITSIDAEKGIRGNIIHIA